MGRDRIHQHREGRVYRAPVAPIVESLEERKLLSTYTVTNVNDSGGGSLRQAILDANSHAGADAIQFAIGTGGKTIAPRSALPGLGDATTLDGTTQPGFAGKPLITLSGSSAGSVDGLKITGGGVIIRGLAINHFKGSGILVMGKGGNTISGCAIGTDASGTAAAGNGAMGVLLQSPNNTVGGYTTAERNIISANGQAGVFVYTAAAKGNTITGNYIGADATGKKKMGNGGCGVQVDGASSNTITRNTISGNMKNGILISNSGATLNVVQRNCIGTNANGTGRLGNGMYGIEISRNDNVVGGRGKAGNIISSNGVGGVVLYLSSSSGNRVQGNLIGTDKTGTKDLGNTGRGVEFTNGAHDNRVGGTSTRDGNTISGNDNGGVGIYSASKMNLLQNNRIGTAASGLAPLPNTGIGVVVTDGAGANYIGGTGVGNTIAFNSGWGVLISKGLSSSVNSNAVHDNKDGQVST